MILIFWVITPFQGAIFGKGPVQLRQSATFYASRDLMPIRDQSKNIDTSSPTIIRDQVPQPDLSAIYYCSISPSAVQAGNELEAWCKELDGHNNQVLDRHQLPPGPSKRHQVGGAVRLRQREGLQP